MAYRDDLRQAEALIIDLLLMAQRFDPPARLEVTCEVWRCVQNVQRAAAEARDEAIYEFVRNYQRPVWDAELQDFRAPDGREYTRPEGMSDEEWSEHRKFEEDYRVDRAVNDAHGVMERGNFLGGLHQDKRIRIWRDPPFVKSTIRATYEHILANRAMEAENERRRWQREQDLARQALDAAEEQAQQ